MNIAAADDPDAFCQPHPDYPSDPFVRRMHGIGYRMTLMVYTSRVDALTIYADS